MSPNTLFPLKWLKGGNVNRKNKLIPKKFKEKDFEMIKNKEKYEKSVIRI